MMFRLFPVDGLPPSLHEGTGLLKKGGEPHACGLSTADPHPLCLNLLPLYLAGAPGQLKQT